MKNKNRVSYERRKQRQGLALIFPWIIGFLVFTLYPIVYSVFLSFQQVYITSGGIRTEFIGLNNYRRALFTDAAFMTQLLLFVRLLFTSVPIIVIFALFMSMLINFPIKARGFFRAVFFLPVVISSGEVIKELLSQGAGSIPILERYGVIATLQSALPPSLAEPVVAIVSQLIIMLWFSGVQILIFLAGLQKIDGAVYEAASVDGASPWEAFWKITLPYLKSFILINIVYSIVNLCTSPLNEIIVKIRGDMYSVATGYGYATGMAWLYFVAIFLLIGVVVVLFGRSDREVKKKRVRV